MRSGHSAVPENWENLHKQGDFELGFERWADIFPEKEELAIPVPSPCHSHSFQDTESQFDQTSTHSSVANISCGWEYLVGDRTCWVGSLKRSQSFHDPRNFRGRRNLFLVGREEFLGWTGCGTVPTWRSAAASHSRSGQPQANTFFYS